MIGRRPERQRGACKRRDDTQRSSFEEESTAALEAAKVQKQKRNVQPVYGAPCSATSSTSRPHMVLSTIP